MERIAFAGEFATVLILLIKTWNSTTLSPSSAFVLRKKGRPSQASRWNEGSGLLEIMSPPLTPPSSCLAWGTVLDNSGHPERDSEEHHG